MITIRRAEKRDIPRMGALLVQVCNVHHRGRPDLFRANQRKYDDASLCEILKDASRPIFVAVNEDDAVLGYCFCMLQQSRGDGVMTDVKTLYIDDLCVDESCRGQHIGSALYEAVKTYAKEIGCYHLTLNVWSHNEDAMAFYRSRGMKPQKIAMEEIL